MGIIGICVRVTALLVLVMATSNRCAPIPATTGLAQSQLPQCPAQRHPITSPWSNCLGTFTLANGEKYIGEYRDDKRNGQGTYMFSNGAKYVGEWRDDKRHGQGTFTFPNGDKYVGEVRDGKEDGQGTYTYANGDKYIGEWRDNKHHGQGTFTFAGGIKYVGEYRDDKRNGLGTEYSPQGAVLKNGIWHDGELVAKR